MLGSVSDTVAHHFGDDPIDDAGVRVWSNDLDLQKIEIEQLSWLSTNEHVRVARLKSPLERQRYIASCVSTRRALSDMTGILPENLEIYRDRCGKPYLTTPSTAQRPPLGDLLKFNISHSENGFCIVAALGRDVGVDVEVVNPNLDVLAISKASLHSEDIDRIQRALPDERSLVFYRVWTRREAFAKMLGHGVDSDHLQHAPSMPWSLRSLEFTLGEKQIVGSVAFAASTTR
jgi:4'-phosphopantetheinyl transferase